jgi:hypothetical protein
MSLAASALVLAALALTLAGAAVVILSRVFRVVKCRAELAQYELQMNAQRAWSEEVARPRNANPKRLVRYGHKVYSQNDEDGVIEEIFRRIGVASRTFVEFGVGTGTECNTARLLVEGWRGLWIEADRKRARAIRRNFEVFINDGKLKLAESLVTAENINGLIARGGLPGEIDLLGIDVDYNDYWIWKAIDTVSPRVVVVEYNPSLPPPMSLAVPYRPDAKWDGTNFHGASLEALVRLGVSKNYRIVGCSIAGVNAFFVRADLCGDRFLEPATAQEHYEPSRDYFFALPAGYKPRPGPFLEI